MNKVIYALCGSCQWASCAILSILPFAVATDFGGVLHWTQYVAALAVVFAAVLATSALVADTSSRTLRRHALLLPVVIWLAYSYFQTVSLPGSMVSTLSGGSAEAYTTWINPFLDSASHRHSFPVSVNVFASRHATAFLAIVAILAWTSAMVFTTRARLVFLLAVTSIGGATIALLGIWRLIDPNFSLWSMTNEAGGGPFSTFVNRNNAALLLNLGFASGLGLVCWRLSALTGSEIDDALFEFSDLVSMLGDRYAMVGIVGIVLSGTGLLVCGSRGGLVAAIIGIMLALGWVRQRRGVVSLPVVGILLAICIAILVVPTNLSFKSIERMDALVNENSGGVWNDGRLKHFPDGLRAARAYFPAGSGLSTYAFSHLPYQETGSPFWHLHADNLWLELIVEQGLMGAILALAIFAMTIHSLYFLARSPDPMDQGLRITGWYAVGAILASQAFDFGLIVPANLLLVAVLLPAIIVRRVEAAVIVPTEDGHAPSPRVFQHRGFAVFACILPILLIIFALPSLKKLRTDADAERVEWTAKREMRNAALEPEALQTLSDLLSSQIEVSPNAALLDWLFRVEYERLRLLSIMAANPDSESKIAELFRQTSRAARRLSTGVEESPTAEGRQPRPSSEGSAETLDEKDQQLLAINERSLLLLPLGRESRAEQISLEYLHGDSSKVTTAIEQLLKLYTGNVTSLMELGGMAAETGNSDLAVTIFRQVVSDQPYLIRKVLETTAKFDHIDQSMLLTERPEVHRMIAPELIVRWERDQSPQLKALLSTVKIGLKCDTCRTGNERAACEEHFGDIAAGLGDASEAIEAYGRALKYAPTEFSVWKKTVELMRSQGDINGAREAARRAKYVLPNEAEFFEKLILEIAAEEVRGIDESKLIDPSTIPQ